MFFLQEADVAITDLLLAVEGIVLGFLLIRSKRAAITTSAFLFYAAIALSSLLGAIVHGFFSQNDSGYALLWSLTLVTLGLVSLFSWTLGSSVAFPRYTKVITVLATLVFIAYAYYIISVDSAFTVAIWNYIPSTVFLLVAFVSSYVQTRKHSLLLGIAGIILTFVAAGIQQLQIAIHPVYFGSNALYHVTEALALLLFFFSLRALTRKVSR